jgi:hypothetical protein
MGWLSRQLDSWNEAKSNYQLGCEVLGPPSTTIGLQGSVERADRIAAGRREAERRAAIQTAKEEAGVYGNTAPEDRYYSQDRGYAAADYFLDKNGNPTNERPHLHVIHNPREGKITFVVTRRDGTHGETDSLPIDAPGNEVNAKQARLLGLLD